MIENGSEINNLTKSGLSVIHMAAQGNNLVPLIYFHEIHNVNIDLRDLQGASPLHWACYYGSESFLTFLLYKYNDKINLNNQDNNGMTALHLAILSGILV